MGVLVVSPLANASPKGYLVIAAAADPGRPAYHIQPGSISPEQLFNLRKCRVPIIASVEALNPGGVIFSSDSGVHVYQVSFAG